MSWDSKRIHPVAPPRRIITSHDPSDTDGNNVTIFDEAVPTVSVLDGGAHMSVLYAHSGIPSINPHSTTSSSADEFNQSFSGVVFPGGTNGRFTDLAPGFKVEYHRTSSVDYNIIIEGSVTLITPLPGGQEKRTEVKAGEVVIQTGTLHAWEAGPQGARWYSVIVSALPVKVGDEDGNELADVDF